MIVLKWIRSLYKVLSADASPSAIAFATAFGILGGFLPFTTGLAMLLIALILVVRVQASTAIAVWLLASLIRLGAAPLFFEVGWAVLENESLRPFWTWFLNLPVVAWLDLDRYAVLGGAICGLALGAAIFFPMRGLVIAYRRWAHERLSQNRFFRWLMSFWFVRLLRFIFVG
ncbi:MAG TPA: TIGR03546 family protein [Planctomycetota bacterium]|nr:TIGR03546 family protein [Planctomycetota bacterium]